MKPLIPLTGIVNLVLSELSLVDCVKMCFYRMFTSEIKCYI